jgi:hypothetical protein
MIKPSATAAAAANAAKSAVKATTVPVIAIAIPIF